MRFRMASARGAQVFVKRYGGFSGVDFSVDPSLCGEGRSPGGVNMYADAAGCLKKRRGWRRLASVAAPVRGIYSYRGIFVVHGGGCLYTWCGGTDTPQLIYSGLGGEKSRALSHGGNLYIMTGAEYMRIGPARREGVVYGYDHSADRALKTVVEVEDERVTVKKYRYNTSNLVRDFELTGTENLTQSLVAEPVREVGYAPITHMNCRMETSANPNSSLISFSGEEYEPSNMAVRCRRNNFTLDTDGTAAVYPVVDSMIAHDAVLSDLELVTAAGNVIENVLFFCDSGDKSETLRVGGTAVGSEKWRRYLYLDAVALKDVMGCIGDESTTVNIRYPAEGGIEGRVEACSIAAWFCGRMFLAGNAEFPNADWYSEVDEPTYFKEINYTEVGNPTSPICAYLLCGEELGIIKGGTGEAALYLRRAEWSDAGYYFPLRAGAVGTGCVGERAAATLADDAMYLSSEGVMAIAREYITGERVLAPRSGSVNLRLTREAGLENAVLGVWNGNLLCCVNGNVYLADGRARTYPRNTSGAFEYEWFFWQGVPIRCMNTYSGALIFGTDEGALCRMSDDLSGAAAYTDYPDGIGGTGYAVCAEWATPFDDDGDFMVKKTMPRRGSGVLCDAVGQARVIVRTDRELEREIEARSRGVYDTPRPAALRSRVRKYSVIQLVCVSDTPEEFALMGIERRFVKGRFIR